MPSKYQSGRGSKTYDSEAKRMLATKNDATLRGLIRGIRDPDRARRYVQAEIELADEEDREPRKKLIGMCNRKVSELKPDDPDDEDADDTVDKD